MAEHALWVDFGAPTVKNLGFGRLWAPEPSNISVLDDFGAHPPSKFGRFWLVQLHSPSSFSSCACIAQLRTSQDKRPKPTRAIQVHKMQETDAKLRDVRLQLTVARSRRNLTSKLGHCEIPKFERYRNQAQGLDLRQLILHLHLLASARVLKSQAETQQGGLEVRE